MDPVQYSTVRYGRVGYDTVRVQDKNLVCARSGWGFMKWRAGGWKRGEERRGKEQSRDSGLGEATRGGGRWTGHDVMYGTVYNQNARYL